MEGKVVNVPVASHGLHKHQIQAPTLASHGFFDYFPVYNKELLKGEKIDLNISMFGRTNPLTQAAFMTGKYVIKKFFVPYYHVFSAYYDFITRTKHSFRNGGNPINVNVTRYSTLGLLSNAFVINNYLTPVGDQTDNFDVIFREGSNNTKCIFSPEGRQVYRVLRSLGIAPTWFAGDTRRIDVMPALCYLKAYIDWIYPSQYADSQVVHAINQMLMVDTSTSLMVDAAQLVRSIYDCTFGYYDESLFDYAWDRPVNGNFNDRVTIPDITSDSGQVVLDQNNTPVIEQTGVDHTISQYLLDSLQSINNFVKRHQLSGSRLIDNFKTQRGLDLSSAVANRSLWLGEDSVPLKVGDVENNAGGSEGQDNLGELAGKGLVDNNNHQINLNFEASEDGQLIVMLVAVPDAPMVMAIDPNLLHVDPYDKYHSEFDKVGVEAIDSNSVHVSYNGEVNEQMSLDGPFGFLNRYYGQVLNNGRLLGDFILKSRGAETLRAYHSFRMFDLDSMDTYGPGLHHNIGFLNDDGNHTQYQRFFYSAKADNLMTLLWFDGSAYQNKLPLGDSFDWDDDEFNRKVSVVLNGTKK